MILRKINLEYGVLLGLIGVNLFLYSSWGDPWGGWAFGPRYLIPSMAILSLFIGIFLHEIKYKWTARIVAYIFFVYSSAVSLLGTLTTNAVPPKVEADFLHMQYNFLRNYFYFKKGESSSFVYNNFLSGSVSLSEYFLIIYGVFVTCFTDYFIFHSKNRTRCLA